ncbi:FeoA family protein [Anaeromicropila populeti]|uniref:Ferrous iron transport protein A n=1 Tax=Anaeromicropila populeti TaxID=37658 RepID=A0A1I6IP95_9FIRM|nr:FeoA family protein [Anaeromicropila populeti]SFR68548.1 ferrous iron transport protein A [Anaeromicropila populeti]
MPLSYVKLGEEKEMVGFRGQDDMRRHLQDMGFVNGVPIKVVSENDSGLILLIKGVKVAINKGLASKIMVN